jgi:dethiobiotin synthetase
MKKMQDKSKIYSIQDKAPTLPQTKPYRWQTPISPHKSANQEESRGLMKISANYLSVSMYLISMSPFST